MKQIKDKRCQIMENEKKNRTTGIEWTDHTWNPFIGCSKISDGCHNCYAIRTAYRLKSFNNPHYKNVVSKKNDKVNWTGKINLNSQNVLNKPNKIQNDSIIFVNSMSDFFHSNVEFKNQKMALEVMMENSRHQFQVLTKRPENIQKFLNKAKMKKFPDNVWIGTTVEGQKVKDRIQILKKIKARIKFLSIEPLIDDIGNVSFKGIDWIITGGESGPNARVMKIDWLRKCRDIATRDNVPHFFKQFGKPTNNPLYWRKVKGVYIPRDNAIQYVNKNDPIGKGGSKLDGRHWKEMPNNFKVSKVYSKNQQSVLLN